MKIEVSKKGETRLLDRHPWVYRSDVISAPDGVGVFPVYQGKHFLGNAVYNPKSEISVRVFEFSPVENLENALLDNFRRAIRRRKKATEALPEGGFRLCHAEGDLVPATVVDYYAGHAVMQIGSAALEPLIPRLTGILRDELPLKSILAKNDQNVRKLEGLEAYVKPLFGEVPEFVWVTEGEIRYRVDLAAGQKTGAFIDQRENRIRLYEFSGEKALDVFSYHGSFALHLAKRFKKVIAVDSSADAISRGLENARENKIENLEGLVANAFDFLKDASKSSERFDLIVLDPPAFAKNKKDLDKAYSAYKEINLRAMKLLNPGGILATASCSHHVSEAMFYGMLTEASADAHKVVRILEKRGQPFDHPVLLNVPETQYLKFALLEVR